MTNEAINQPTHFILESELPLDRAAYLNDFFQYVKEAFEGIENILLVSEELFFDPDNHFHNTKFSFAISDKKTNNQMSIFIDNDNQIFLIDSFGSKFMGKLSSSLTNLDFENTLDRISLKKYDTDNGTHLFITKDLDGNNVEAPEYIEDILVKAEDQIEEKLKVTLYIINGQISYAIKFQNLQYISLNQSFELSEEEFNKICKDCDIDFKVYVKENDGSISRYKRIINNGFSNNEFSKFAKSYSTTTGANLFGDHLYEISAVSSFLIFLGIYYFPTIKNFISGPAAPQIMPAPQQQDSSTDTTTTNQVPQGSPTNNNSPIDLKKNQLTNLLNKNKDSTNNRAITTTTPRVAKSISTQTTPMIQRVENYQYSQKVGLSNIEKSSLSSASTTSSPVRSASTSSTPRTPTSPTIPINDRYSGSLESVKNNIEFTNYMDTSRRDSPSSIGTASSSAIQEDGSTRDYVIQLPQSKLDTLTSPQIPSTPARGKNHQVPQTTRKTGKKLIEPEAPSMKTRGKTDARDQRLLDLNDKKIREENLLKTNKKTAKKTAKKLIQFEYSDDNMLSIATDTPTSPVSSHNTHSFETVPPHILQVKEITVKKNQLIPTSSAHNAIGFNPTTNEIISYKKGAKGNKNIIELDADALEQRKSLQIQGFKFTLEDRGIDSEIYQSPPSNDEAIITLTSEDPDNKNRIEKFKKIASKEQLKTVGTMIANGKIPDIDNFQIPFLDELSDIQVKKILTDNYQLKNNEANVIIAAQQGDLKPNTKDTKGLKKLKDILIKAQETLKGGVPLWVGFTFAMITRGEASSIQKIYIDNEEDLQDECVNIFDKDENNVNEICGIEAHLIKQFDGINSAREDYQHIQNIKKVSLLTAQSLVCNFITPMITRKLAESNKLSLAVYGSEFPKIVSSAAATGTCNYVFETSANIMSYELVKDITCSSVFIATSIYLPIPGINYLAGSITQKSCDLTFNYFVTGEFPALTLSSGKSAVIITGCGILSSQVVANSLDDPTISSSAALTTNQLCSKTASSLYDYVYSFIFGETYNPAISSEHSCS